MGGTSRRVMAWLLGAVTLILAAASFLPLVETNAWWVRYLDFPRAQLGMVLAAALPAFALLAGWRGPGRGAVLFLGAAALGYQGWKLHPYLPVMPPMAVTAGTCPPEDRLRVLIANVKRENRDARALLARVAEADPDLLLVMETNGWWDRALAPLDAAYPHSVQHIPAEATHYGLHLFSKRPLDAPEIVLGYGPDTPAVMTGVRMPSGAVIGFHGVHPRPPVSFERSTARRDATILRAALDVAAGGRPAILAGDLNAVPWERVTRRAMRLGSLLDPRVGRGLIPTYDSEDVLKRWPLDQILHTAELTVMDVGRLDPIDSDHFPFMATLCHDPSAAARQQPPAPLPGDMAEARASLAAAEARAASR